MSTKMFKFYIILFVATLYRINAEECGIKTGGAVIQQLTDRATISTGPEGIFYDLQANKLYYVDRSSPTLYCMNGKTAEINSAPIPDVSYIQAAIPIKGVKDKMIGVADNSIKLLQLEKDSKGNIVNITTQETGFEINLGYELDSTTDKKNRLLTATTTELKGDGKGKILAVQKDGSVKELSDKVSLSGGIDFSSDFSALFQGDSIDNVIYEYKYNLKAGTTIGDPVVVYNLTLEENIEGFICAIEVQKNNDIWIAICETGILLNFSPKTKECTQIYQLPEKYITSLEMGGPDMDIVFVGTRNTTIKMGTAAIGNLYAISGTGTEGNPRIKLTM